MWLVGGHQNPKLGGLVLEDEYNNTFSQPRADFGPHEPYVSSELNYTEVALCPRSGVAEVGNS